VYIAIKLNKKYSPILFGVIMGVMMSFFMSLFISLVNIGIAPNFFEVWMRAFPVAFVIGLPVAFVVWHIAKRVVARLTA
jgi:Protein of unknown function (DUF2798)